MKSERITGVCKKLNEECEFIAEYNTVRTLSKEGYKLMDMLNVETDKKCHEPFTCYESRRCDAYNRAIEKGKESK
ncbi:hypothetical protein [Clostridium sp. VAP52]|uniref:hypothetical protein n=1 Tax=Clostridium sp. VAP52 TaxID=2949977 RepID=UPI002079601C|nr:hypothetical protein [Clostridium sp. VAP52]